MALGEIFNLCSSGNDPPENINTTQVETPDTSYDEKEEYSNRIIGIEDPKHSNRHILDQPRRNSGLFNVNIKDLDVSVLHKHLKPDLVSISIVKNNMLKLTFNRIGYMIDPKKYEKKNGVITLHIVDTRQNYGDPQPAVESLSSYHTIPKGTHTIKCN